MLLISDALAQAGGAPQASSQWFQLLFLVGIFVLFYLLLIRPQRKRQKEHENMVQALEKNDEIVTSGGILGRITATDEHYISVRIAQGVEIKMQRISVMSVLPRGTLKSLGSEERKTAKT